MISDSQAEIFLDYFAHKTGRNVKFLQIEDFYDGNCLIFYCYSEVTKDMLKSDENINIDSNLKQLVDNSICGLTFDYIEVKSHVS